MGETDTSALSLDSTNTVTNATPTRCQSAGVDHHSGDVMEHPERVTLPYPIPFDERPPPCTPFAPLRLRLCAGGRSLVAPATGHVAWDDPTRRAPPRRGPVGVALPLSSRPGCL